MYVLSAGDYEAEIKVSAGLVPSEARLLGVQMAVFSPHHTTSPVRALCPEVLFLQEHQLYWSRAHPNDLV